MARAKVRADCRADTRGGPWVGIPLCVIKSAAWRHLSLPARAILVEIVARMNGWNNGSIAISQREIAEALGLTNFRNISPAIAELMKHGLIDIPIEGGWKQRQARQYRVTFVSTKSAAATNEYRDWAPTKKSGDATVAATGGQSAATAAAGRRKLDATAAARIQSSRRKSANLGNEPAATVASLIYEPCVPPKIGEKIDQINQASSSFTSRPSVANGNLSIEASDQIIRAAIAAIWDQLDQPHRQALAGKHNVSVGEIDRYLSGQPTHIVFHKAVALRSSAMALSGHAA